MTKFSRLIFEAKTKKEVLPDGTIRTERNGCIEYTKDGEYHRIGGPAYINKKNGYEAWYKNGKLHRADGPAIVKKGKFEEWYLNGVLFRADGPSRTEWNMDGSIGVEAYWVNDRRLSKKEYYKHFGKE